MLFRIAGACGEGEDAIPDLLSVPPGAIKIGAEIRP